MSAYYYLVSSLPMLRFDDRAPFASDTFLQLCKQHASHADFMLIEKTHYRSTGNEIFRHPLLKAWHRFWHATNLLLTQERSRKLGVESERYKVGSMAAQADSTDVVRAVMSAEHPLQAETMLLESCWKKLDWMGANHLFDIEFLLVYRMKLQVLERKDLFTPLEGNAEFKRLFSNLQTTIKSL